ncbi:MAG: phosphatase PAP2 family protein [Acidimicrobiia bacterium]
MHPSVAAFDARVEQAVERLRAPALDQFFYPVSSAADHSLLWFIVGAAKGLRHGDVRLAARFSAAMGLESALTNGPVKALFRRDRPAPDTPAGPLPYGMHRPITTSFPSGHATAAFTAATLLYDDHPGPWLLLAAVVAGSRVYVRMHHASDVVGGAVFGLALGHALRHWVRIDRR